MNTTSINILLTTTNCDRWLGWLSSSTASGLIHTTPKGLKIYVLYKDKI